MYAQLKKQLENLTVVENQARAGILGVEEAFANMNTTGQKLFLCKFMETFNNFSANLTIIKN